MEERTYKKTKKAWVISLREKTRNLRTNPLVAKSAFYMEMRPILFGFVILGRLYFRFNKQGKMESRIFSLWLLYWISVYSFLSFLATADLIALWDMFTKEKHFMQVVRQLINFTILVLHFLMPLLTYLESDRICNFFNDWADYQEIYENLTDDVLKTRYDRTLRLCLCATPFIVTGIVIFERTVFFNQVWYHLIVFACVLLLLYCYLFFWCFSLMEIANCAAVLNKKLKTSVGKFCEAKEIHRYRILWLKLNTLVESAGGSIPYTLMKMSILNYCAFIMSAYVLISCFIQGINYEAFQFLGIMCFTGLMTALSMEAGHNATEKVNKLFFDTLMETDITEMDYKCLKEFNLLVKLVSKSGSVVTLIGYVNVNRPTIAALLASTVTYLIVLVQFNQSPAHIVH